MFRPILHRAMAPAPRGEGDAGGIRRADGLPLVTRLFSTAGTAADSARCEKVRWNACAILGGGRSLPAPSHAGAGFGTVPRTRVAGRAPADRSMWPVGLAR